MVKNTGGGCKAKKFARKGDAPAKDRGFIRLPECDEEQYACVTKLNGNTCNVITVDGTPLLAHIRNKFSGKNKRSNIIATNTVLLIGLRDWESTKKNCDVLEVYSAQEVEQLRTIPKLGIERLNAFMTEVGGVKQRDTNEDVVFSTAGSDDILPIQSCQRKQNDEEKFELVEQDEINIDDI